MNTFVRLIPVAIKIAQAIEALPPGGGRGKAKFGIALKLAEGAWDSAEDLRKGWGDKEQFSQAMGQAIDASVELMNEQGVFAKGR